MKRLLFIAFISLLPLYGCGSSSWCEIGSEHKTDPIKFALPFTVFCSDCEDETAFTEAVEEWNQSAGFEVFKIQSPYSSDDPINVIVHSNPDWWLLIDDALAKDEYWGIAYFSDGAWRIEIREEQITNTQLIVHELGHSLGFMHSDCKCSIMFKHLKDCQQITDEMVDLLSQESSSQQKL